MDYVHPEQVTSEPHGGLYDYLQMVHYLALVESMRPNPRYRIRVEGSIYRLIPSEGVYTISIEQLNREWRYEQHLRTTASLSARVEFATYFHSTPPP